MRGQRLPARGKITVILRDRQTQDVISELELQEGHAPLTRPELREIVGTASYLSFKIIGRFDDRDVLVRGV